MAATADILQTAEGDWDVSSGDFRLTPDLQTFVVQGLDQNYQFWLGEWYLNILEGTPYFDRVIGAKPDQSLQTAIFRQVAAKTIGVGGVLAMSAVYDGPTRVQTVSGRVQTTKGDTIDFGPLVIGEGA